MADIKYYATIARVAKIIGVSRQSIHQRIEAGHIKAVKLPPKILVIDIRQPLIKRLAQYHKKLKQIKKTLSTNGKQ